MSINFRGPEVGGGGLNRYEAFIGERRLFHFNCNNVKKTNKTRSLLAE